MRTEGRLQAIEFELPNDEDEGSGVRFWLEDVTELETGPRRL